MTLIDKYRQFNNFGRLIDMDFKIIDDGIVEYEMIITQAHLATPGAAHGGVISALVDGALGVAALSAVYKQNKIVSTIEFKLNFLAPALLNDRIVAKAKVDQLGNRIIVSSCEVICMNRDNKLLAKAMGTFNAYDAAKAGY
ncbi:MAG TPA: PaaI family thioesterase [Bacteroidia bacterium]|nr:PaaI family thioesterase [Bacteroidia bacterium]